VAEALIACRFLHFVAAMVLFGTSIFACWLVPEGLRPAVERPLRRLAGVALLVAVATAVLWLLLESAGIAGAWGGMVDPDTLWGVLSATEFGRVWDGRLLLGALLLGSLVVRLAGRWPVLALLSGLFLASLGRVGHAAMDAGTLGVLHRLNHAVHLLAGANWAGALLPLWICLRAGREPGREADLATLLRRFSGSGHVAVALVLASGVTDTFLDLGHLPLDFASPYQAMLAAKIALVGVMVLIALRNRYLVMPRLRGARPEALRQLVRGTVAELVLGGLVIALVSAFATFDPR